MKTSKSLLRAFLALALVLAVVGTAAGCVKPSSSDKILLDQESYTCEFGEIFLVPMATCTNGEEVTVQIFDADGYEVPVEYGTATLEKGTFKMVFTAGAVTKEVPVICADTTAPKIFVSVGASAAVGHTFTLPAVTTDDLSGVNEEMTKVELYKAGESTPVLTVPGESIVVEDVGYYTLKITVVDNEGNVGTTEKKITAIVRPDSEVLQDFSKEVTPLHQSWWGGGDPWFQWYAEYEGKQGVIGLGCDNYTKVSDGLNAYIWWTNLGMENLDLSGATGFTIKLKAENCRALYFKTSGNKDIPLIELGEGWVEVYVDLVNATDLFEDMSKASIGFAVAPAQQFTGPCIWIDEVVVHYTPRTMYNVTVEDGSINYDSNRVPEGFKATVTHDASKTPAGKAFSYWLLNGEKLVGDTFVVTGDIVLTPVYVDKVEEQPIPEGSVLVSDFSTAGAPWNNPGWGSGACGLSSWYGNFEGIAGVQAFGTAQDGALFSQWTSVIPLPKIYDDANGFDYHGYTTITLRLKVNKDALSAIYIGDTAVSYEFLGQIPASNEWATVTLDINDSMGAYYLMIGTKAEATAGEMVWIDQVWVTKSEAVDPVPTDPQPTDPKPTDPQPTDPSITELAIPEGSVLVKDFSAESSAIWNNPNWGTGAVGQSTWYAQYDGVAGVQAFGAAQGGAQYTQWTSVIPLPKIYDDANGFDYHGYTTITLRLKVNKDAIRALYIGDTAGSYEFLGQVPVSNEWTTVTLEINDSMGAYYLMIGTSDGAAAGESVWIDQVWVTKVAEPVVEQAIPEGSVLVKDFSAESSAIWNNPNWGTGAVGQSTWYAEYDGVAGVQAFGAAQGGAQYTMWTSVIPLPKIYDDANGFDYHGYTTITLRLKVNKDAIRALYIGDPAGSYEFLGQVPVSNEWTTVTLPINDSMGAYYLMIGTSDGAAAGESVWIDQVWVTKVAEPVVEQAIPEGAVLVKDFSTAAAPWNNPNWGFGAVGQTAWYAEYDGVAGVQAFGATQGGALYTQWASVIPLPKIYDDANGFNYHGYTTITLRLKVNKDAIRALYIGDTAGSYEFLGQVPVSNEWTTVTLPINDSMGAYYLMIGTSDGAAAGESVWIDQVYVQ